MTAEDTITDRAAEKILVLIAGAKEGHGLRVNVVEGGCSGFEYRMEIDAPSAEDRVFEKNGASVVLDAKSLLHLNGTELDYKSGLMELIGTESEDRLDKKICPWGAIEMYEFDEGAELSKYFYVSKNIKAVNGLYVSEAAEKKRLEAKQMELYESGQ